MPRCEWSHSTADEAKAKETSPVSSVVTKLAIGITLLVAFYFIILGLLRSTTKESTDMTELFNALSPFSKEESEC